MGKFKTLVQKGNITGPLRRQFKPAQWTIDYQEHGMDEEDSNLYLAGLDINLKGDAIRASLAVTNSTLSATTKLRAFVAVSNQNICVLKDKSEQFFAEYARKLSAEKDEPVMLHELAAMKVKVLGGFEFSPNEIAEVSVDGIETPIRVILKSQESPIGNSQNSKINWEQVAVESNLGGLYSLMKDLWDECLWNDYVVKSAQGQRVYFPRLEAHLESLTVSRTRGRAIGVQFATMSSQIQKQRPELQSYANTLVADVTAISKVGRKQMISLSRSATSSPEHQHLFTLRALATEPYYSGLLKEPRAFLAGATLEDLLSAWTVIARCSAILLASLRSRTFAKLDEPGTWLPEFAPTLQRRALITAIASACSLEYGKAGRLLEFFTFRGMDGQEIWAQPLIPVNPDSVAPVIAALSSPNLRRLIDVWLRQTDVDLSLRGPAFESHIRSSLGQAISTSPLLLKDAQVLEGAFVFRSPGGREEEVDTVFRVGHVVFFCELKCILDPTEAKGVAMHRKTVHEATLQVLRKVDAARKNPVALLNQLAGAGFKLDKNPVVHPLVILSSAFHAGTAVNGVAVVDELILEKFFEGELIDVAIQSPNGAMDVKKKTVFYTDEVHAESEALAYFLKPPQMRVYREGLSKRWIPVHAVSETDWSALMLVFDCMPVTPVYSDVDAEI